MFSAVCKSRFEGVAIAIRICRRRVEAGRRQIAPSHQSEMTARDPLLERFGSGVLTIAMTMDVGSDQ
jgi:hypothetical protein